MSHIRSESDAGDGELLAALGHISLIASSLIDAAQDLSSGTLNMGTTVDDIESSALDVLRFAEDAITAVDLISRSVPLADEFPSGDPAPDRPTPRQVIFLAKLAARQTESGWPDS